jgi:hypothetical protein
VKLGSSSAWEKIGYNLWRASVPGGWLVAGFEAGSANSVAFVPDPTHAWDGRALWGAGAQPTHADAGAVSLLPERAPSE